MEGIFESQVIDSGVLFLAVFVEKPDMCEVVSVLFGDKHCFEASGLLDNDSIKDGIVECGKVFGRIGVFFGKAERVGVTNCENKSDEFVVVVVMVPVPQC